MVFKCLNCYNIYETQQGLKYHQTKAKKKCVERIKDPEINIQQRIQEIEQENEKIEEINCLIYEQNMDTRYRIERLLEERREQFYAQYDDLSDFEDEERRQNEQQQNQQLLNELPLIEPEEQQIIQSLIDPLGLFNDEQTNEDDFYFYDYKLYGQINKQRNFKNKYKISQQCNICLNNETNIITKCGHYFHNQCIQKWLNQNDNCPNCRKYIIPNYQ